MTIKSVITGFFGAAMICGFTFINDYVLHQTYMVGNHFPVSVFGALLIFLMINTLLFKFRESLAFTGKELAIVLGMTLVSCCIPSQGFLAIFPTTAAMPHKFVKTDPGLQKARITDEVCPPGIMLDVEKTVASGTVAGCMMSKVTLDDAASSETNAYRGMTLHIFAATGARQTRNIVEYDGATRTAAVKGDWRYEPKPGDKYLVRRDNEDETLTPFIFGVDNMSGKKDASKSLFDIVPWGAWKKPLFFWIPLVLAFWFAIMGLSMVVHRQWAEHEHLPYPLSTITASLLPREDGSLSSVFKSRQFQIAFFIIAAIYVNNYVQIWFPDYWFRLPLRIDVRDFVHSMGWKAAHYVNWPTVFFSVIAISYFLSADVCFSLGLTGVLYSFVFCTVLAKYGIHLNQGHTGYVKNEHFLLFGAFLGTAIVVIYTGRQFYLSVAKKSLFLKSVDDIPQSSIWGGRAFIVGAVIFISLLISVGTPWPLAILYTGLLFMIHAILGRIVAETGLFFIQTGWGYSLIPTAILLGLLGPQCISPEISVVLFMVCIIFCMDTRECLFPFALNTFRLFQLKKVKIERTVPMLGLAIVVGLTIAVPVTLYCQYRFGVNNMQYPWVTTWLPSHPVRETKKLMTHLEARGQLTDAMYQPITKRLTKIRPMSYGYLGWTGAGLGIVIFLSFCRLKFKCWPLHPVMFLMFLGYSMAAFWFSFLLGWLIKWVIFRYGGTRAYQGLKPLFIGLLAGELVGALIPMVFGFIYYMWTGDSPKTFRVFPM